MNKKGCKVVRLTPAMVRHLDFPEVTGAVGQRIKVHHCASGAWKVRNTELKRLALKLARAQARTKNRLKRYIKQRRAEIKRDPKSGVPLPNVYLKYAHARPPFKRIRP